ncbi:hypothetical protein OHAE_3441 [Ochrobactrum soli]|uniref:Uncharacterized protein n=1 Tax=Ochrobactrum soli TaxID=2448455 RepID=A0A2P9HHF0_9HYPH|nr:hypothetical protein OHAE_3441 [[Ochrobactrum] soli]
MFGHDIRSFPNLKHIACGLLGSEGAAGGIWRSAYWLRPIVRMRRIDGQTD